MQFIVAFANEKIFNIQAKSIVGAKRMANSLRIAIGSDAVYVICRDTGEIWKRERFINEDSSGWTKWTRVDNHVSAKVEPPYLPPDKAVLHDISLICNKALQDEEERKMGEEEMRLRGVLMQIAVIAHNGAMQNEAR